MTKECLSTHRFASRAQLPPIRPFRLHRLVDRMIWAAGCCVQKYRIFHPHAKTAGSGVFFPFLASSLFFRN